MAGQKGQNRRGRSILECLPVSMSKGWLDNLNLVKADLYLKLGMSIRYFSMPISFLSVLYVFSLLFSFLKDAKAFW